MGRIGMPELIILGVLLFLVIRTMRSALRGGSGLIVLGTVIGAVIAFLVRPSLPLIGQLPFATVITRGANLRGLDVLAKSTAETSFNYVAIGALVGLAAGVAISRIGRSAPQLRETVTEPQVAPSTAASRYCANCGSPLIPDSKFCNSCGTKIPVAEVVQRMVRPATPA